MYRTFAKLYPKRVKQKIQKLLIYGNIRIDYENFVDWVKCVKELEILCSQTLYWKEKILSHNTRIFKFSDLLSLSSI